MVQKIKVKCSYCKETVLGNIFDCRSQQQVVFFDICHAEDSYLHYPLYFQASFRGKTIWALNREHLYKTMRSQSDLLPAFMKTA